MQSSQNYDLSGSLLILNQLFLFTQVKHLFGNREELVLPLVLDIANLIKHAGLRQAQTQSKYGEREVPPSIQTLQRSFFSAKPQSFTWHKSSFKTSSDEDESESTATVTDITKLVVMQQRDSTLQVEETGNTAKNTTTIHSRVRRFVQYPNDKKLAQSYHERKFNMTAFNSTDNQIDQDAVASSLSYSIVAPQNITLDEIEDLTFSSLNAGNESTNFNLTTEFLPTPEQLIARKRYRPYKPKLSNRKEIEDCEIFSGTICLHVKNYPK